MEILTQYAIKLRHFRYEEVRDDLDRRKILSKKSIHMMETRGAGMMERDKWVEAIDKVADQLGEKELLEKIVDYIENVSYKYLVVGREKLKYDAYEIYASRMFESAEFQKHNTDFNHHCGLVEDVSLDEVLEEAKKIDKKCSSEDKVAFIVKEDKNKVTMSMSIGDYSLFDGEDVVVADGKRAFMRKLTSLRTMLRTSLRRKIIIVV